MAIDRNKDVPKSVKLDEVIFLHIWAKVSAPGLPKFDFSKFTRAAFAYSAESFRSEPWKYNFVHKRFTDRFPLSDETVTKPFRFSELMDRWARQIVSDISADFTGLTIRCLLSYLPIYLEDPASASILYQTWLEVQSESCITRLHQLEIRPAKVV